MLVKPYENQTTFSPHNHSKIALEHLENQASQTRRMCSRRGRKVSRRWSWLGFSHLFHLRRPWGDHMGGRLNLRARSSTWRSRIEGRKAKLILRGAVQQVFRLPIASEGGQDVSIIWWQKCFSILEIHRRLYLVMALNWLNLINHFLLHQLITFYCSYDSQPSTNPPNRRYFDYESPKSLICNPNNPWSFHVEKSYIDKSMLNNQRLTSLSVCQKPSGRWKLQQARWAGEWTVTGDRQKKRQKAFGNWRIKVNILFW